MVQYEQAPVVEVGEDGAADECMQVLEWLDDHAGAIGARRGNLLNEAQLAFPAYERATLKWLAQTWRAYTPPGLSTPTVGNPQPAGDEPEPQAAGGDPGNGDRPGLLGAGVSA